jgi:ATP-dependent helicase/nuclease subunit B
VRSLLRGDAAAVADLTATAAGRLADLIDAFDDPARAYLAQPHPGSAPRFPAYARLARVAEWSAAGDGE